MKACLLRPGALYLSPSGRLIQMLPEQKSTGGMPTCFHFAYVVNGRASESDVFDLSEDNLKAIEAIKPAPSLACVRGLA